MDEIDSDEEVEMDCYTRVQRGVGSLYGLPAKSKTPLMTFDTLITGRYDNRYPQFRSQVGCCPCMIVGVDGLTRIYGCGAYLPWYLPLGSQSDTVQGTRNCVVDGMQVRMHVWLPEPVPGTTLAFECPLVTQVFIELVYLPNPPANLNGYDGDQISGRYWWERCYGISNSREEMLDAPLLPERIREGYTSVFRKRFTLTRDAYYTLGAQFDDNIVFNDPTGVAPTSGLIGIAEVVTATIVPRIVSSRNWATFTSEEKSLCAPSQKVVTQIGSHWLMDEYVKVNRKFVASDQSELHFARNNENWEKGIFVLNMASDVYSPEGLSEYGPPGQGYPRVEGKFRIKFRKA
jgi:hypothetical protein